MRGSGARGAPSSSRAGAARGGARGGGAPPRSAAASHVANDRYMEQWDAAYAELHGAPPLHLVPAPVGGGGGALPWTAPDAPRDRLPPAPPPPPALSPQWLRGPLDPAGALVNLSDRPLMALAVDPRSTSSHAEAVVGGSDHGVYTIDLVRGERRRVLYTKAHGHSEWVTGVTYTGDGSGRIASCGMDGKVCLWGAGGARGGGGAVSSDLLGHFGSVSCVAAPGGGTPAGGPPSNGAAASLLVSAGYDKSVKVWDTRRGGAGALAADLRGHGAPVLVLALRADDACVSMLAASGDRGGSVRVWDLRAGAGAAEFVGHRGHITSLTWLCAGGGGGGDAGGDAWGSRDLLLAGAQDGVVRVWDLRAGAAASVAAIPAHVSGGGSGAVGDIAVARCSGGETLIVTAGADQRLCTLDPRKGWGVRATLGGHRDFIYTLAVAGGLALSGCGDGTLLAHDVAGGGLLWGLGANRAAVRCVGTVLGGGDGPQRLVAAGDDGCALTYSF